MIKDHLRYLVAAAFAAASGASNVAFAEVELEPNNSIASAQRLVIGSGGNVEVTGSIGVLTLTAPAVDDVDFFSFEGRAGDLVNLDIDGGMKLFSSSVRSVDTVLAIFGPDLKLMRYVSDAADADPGSLSRFDARITDVSLPVSGIYTVAVASSKRQFGDGGAVLTPFSPGFTSNGSYTLIISGVTPPPSVQYINIDIKPGADSIRPPINPKSKGNIPVALLSSAKFDALKADRGSIRFGPNGTEASGRCGKDGEDVNGDGRLDLVCHFDNQAAGFDESDEEGMVKGTIGGMPFEGRGWLKVLAVKREN